jgi:uncharacterized protein (TIGR02391 family)
MVEWLIAVSSKCRSIEEKANDCLKLLSQGQPDSVKAVAGYLKSDFDDLTKLLKDADPTLKNVERIGDLSRHVKFAEENDFNDMVKSDLPAVLKSAEKLALALEGKQRHDWIGFHSLLHPSIEKSSLEQYKAGYLREAVLNGVIAVFDLIRTRTKLDLDGSKLTGQAFGLENGKLIFSEVESESGRNDQVGFMKIYEGVYTGVRNVKAHSLNHDLDERKAGQYLVMLSLLARRVEECSERKQV